MTATEGKGILIYGDDSSKSIPVFWKLTAGKMLSNEEPWRATVVCKGLAHDTPDVDVLNAHDEDFVFKLKTEDGSVFICGTYDIDHMLDAYPTLYFEICSREQRMGKFTYTYPPHT